MGGRKASQKLEPQSKRKHTVANQLYIRLSSFLLFLLCLRPCFQRLFGPKWVSKPNPKRNPKLDPSKRRARLNKKSRVPERGPKRYPKRGGPCGVLSSFLLRCCFLLDFGAFRAHFGPEFVPGKGVGGRVNPPNWKIGRVLNLNHLSPEGAGGDARSVRNYLGHLV